MSGTEGAMDERQIEVELRRIIGALCYEVDRAIADDVYLRMGTLIRASRDAALAAREAAVARLNVVVDAATAFVKCESGQYRAYLYDQLREAVDDLAAPPPGDGAGE